MFVDSTMKNSPHNPPDHYEIRIKAIIDPCWSEWLGCPNLTYTTTGETILSCQVPDQAALHGLLAKIRDMNLKILSVNRVEPNPAIDEDQHEPDQ